VATEGLGQEKSGEHEEEWWRAQATAAARAANTASSSIFAVSCIEDVLGKEGRRKRYSNWAKELGCARDRAGRVTKEVDGLSGKKIKWADLIFEFCFYYLLSLLRGEKFLWGFFYLLITLIQVTKVGMLHPFPSLHPTSQWSGHQTFVAASSFLHCQSIFVHL
jgi:hypothetical protein